MNVFELFAKLGLDTSEYNKGLENSEKSMSDFGTKLKKGITVAAATAAAAITATAAAAGAASKAFVNAAKETADYGDTVDKQSQKVGLSAKTWQEYDYVLKICGTEMSSMTTGLKTMTNQIDAAKKGNKDAIARFKQLGISMKDLKTLSREDIFKKTITGLQNMKEGTDRAAISNKLFGRSGQELQPLFNMTAKETQNLIDKANDLGMVMSDSGVKASAAYKDSLTTLEGSIKGLKNGIMTEFMPSLTNMTEGLAEAFSGKGTKKLTEGIGLMLVELKRVGPDVMKVIKDVGIALIQGIGPLLPDLVSTIFSLLTTAFTTISSMLPELMPSIISGIQGAMSALITALPVIINGVTTLIMSLVEWLSSGDNVQTLVNGIVAMVTQIVNSFGMILPVLLPAIVTIIGEVAKALTEPDNIQMLLDAVLTLVGGLAVGLAKCVPILWEAVKGVIKNLGELLSRFFDWAVPIAANGIEAIVNTVKSWGTAIKNFVLGLINGIKTAISSWINNIKQAFIDGFNLIKEKVSSILSGIGDFVGSVIDKIKELPSKVVSIGKDLVEGLWKGISNKVEWVKDKIKSMGEGITKAIKKVFGVASPSKVFAEVGGFLAEGLGLGYEKEMKNVQKDILGISDDLTSSVMAKTTFATTGAASVGTGSGTVINATFNITGAEGQDIRELAKQISRELQNLVNDKESVYA